jgi:threonylcarbamoyladenosine tRNA methylthiotransferase MtaB
MNRKYTVDEYRQAVENIRSVRKDAAITTDIITGFPGETDDDFTESLNFAEQMNFAALHVFPYSKRDGTKAAELPDHLPKPVKDERTAKMLELGKRLKTAFLKKNIGRTAPVLFESRDKTGKYIGFTPNYIEVEAVSDTDIRGNIMQVELIECDNERLAGVISDLP